jgi:hypothetical protein
VAQAEVDAAWARVGRASGLVAAAGLFVGTVLYLLDATHVLAADAQYHVTGAGALADEANFWVDYFARQHHVLWDVIARDTLFPVAFLALMVLALAVRRRAGAERPETQLMVVFFVVGGLLAALSDLIYLSASEYWRVTGWSADPPARMVAVGRAEGAVETLNHWPEIAGFVVLAAALVSLAQAGLPSGLAVAARFEALMLLGIAFAEVFHADTAYDVFSLITGALIGPLVAGWLAQHVSHG